MNREAALALAASLLLAGCEAEVTKSPKTPPKAAEAPAAGKAEEGQISIKGPGFDLKVGIPKEIAARAGPENGELLYPGATLSGMHVEARPSGGGAGSGVELRFTSPDAAETIAAWYRDPARAAHFAIAEAKQDGAAMLLSGTRKTDGGTFSLRLTPAADGGTEGRLNVSEPS